jgi:hypothetical protein
MKRLIILSAIFFTGLVSADAGDMDQYFQVNVTNVQNAVAKAAAAPTDGMQIARFEVGVKATAKFGIGSDIKHPKPPNPGTKGGGSIGISIAVSPELDLVFVPH